MNASSLLMVIKSRTFGMLCSLTLSAVSKAAAITGSAQFFAPLIATVPRSAFPPLIRNLSLPPRDFSLSGRLYVAIFLLQFFSVVLCALCALCVNSCFFLPLLLIPAAPFANLPPPPQSTSSLLLLPRPASTSPAPLAYCVPPPAERVPPQTLSSHSLPPKSAAPAPQPSHW